MNEENGDEDLNWSEEHDCVPLKLRLKILLAKNQLDSGFSHGIHSHKQCKKPPVSLFDVDKKDDQHFYLQKGHTVDISDPACFDIGEGNEGNDGYPGTAKNEHVNLTETNVNEVVEDVLEERVELSLSTSPSSIIASKCSGKEEVTYVDKKVRDSAKNDSGCSLFSVGQVAKTKTEIANDFIEDLDHIVLKERRRLLLSSCRKLELIAPFLKGNYSSLSNQAGSDMNEDNHGSDKKANSSSTAESLKGNTMVNVESNNTCFSKTAYITNKTSIGQTFMTATPDNLSSSAVSGISSNVKAEPVEHDAVPGLGKGVVCTLFSNNHNVVKTEFPEDSYGDEVDHLLLSDRIKLMASKQTSNVSRVFGSSKKIMPSFLHSSPIASDSTPLKVNRSRKRKTVTDSIETAMEEDAPGLLKVLLDKGVSVNEIKLYGVGENDESPDGLEESFSDLEAVMSKIFFQRQSFLKMGSMRCMKGEKPSYCLACLVSLVEQARYLQFRKWPAEWGWCRDLQSFIFVFERHHRIVLERPEYGYATYFFELVDSLTIDWQIKRLVTVMKLTSCGRITLIENRSLLVGEDMTEGEARVLMEYGWTPSSGLGTMLNYRDRVVHDRKNESDSAEWKSKIGKLLMDGYNGGTFVLPEISTRVVESSGAEEDFQVKLEI